MNPILAIICKIIEIEIKQLPLTIGNIVIGNEI